MAGFDIPQNTQGVGGPSTSHIQSKSEQGGKQDADPKIKQIGPGLIRQSSEQAIPQRSIVATVGPVDKVGAARAQQNASVPQAAAKPVDAHALLREIDWNKPEEGLAKLEHGLHVLAQEDPTVKTNLSAFSALFKAGPMMPTHVLQGIKAQWPGLASPPVKAVFAHVANSDNPAQTLAEFTNMLASQIDEVPKLTYEEACKQLARPVDKTAGESAKQELIEAAHDRMTERAIDEHVSEAYRNVIHSFPQAIRQSSMAKLAHLLENAPHMENELRSKVDQLTVELADTEVILEDVRQQIDREVNGLVQVAREEQGIDRQLKQAEDFRAAEGVQIDRQLAEIDEDPELAKINSDMAKLESVRSVVQERYETLSGIVQKAERFHKLSSAQQKNELKGSSVRGTLKRRGGLEKKLAEKKAEFEAKSQMLEEEIRQLQSRDDQGEAEIGKQLEKQEQLDKLQRELDDLQLAVTLRGSLRGDSKASQAMQGAKAELENLQDTKGRLGQESRNLFSKREARESELKKQKGPLKAALEEIERDRRGELSAVHKQADDIKHNAREKVKESRPDLIARRSELIGEVEGLKEAVNETKNELTFVLAFRTAMQREEFQSLESSEEKLELLKNNAERASTTAFERLEELQKQKGDVTAGGEHEKTVRHFGSALVLQNPELLREGYRLINREPER